MLENYPEILTLEYVCKIMRISKPTASSLIRSHKLDALMVGRAYRISKSSLIRFFEGNGENKETVGNKENTEDITQTGKEKTTSRRRENDILL